MLYNVAIAGATGNVGRELLNILDERGFPIRNAVALASSRSVGKEISFGEEKTLIAQDLAEFDFSDTDIVFSSPGGATSAEHSPRAAKAGAIVIDNTSHFRMHDDVPLVVPEVNEADLQDFLFLHQSHPGGIIANPNCSTIQMVTALKPLHDLATITRVNVATYQSVSGAGKDAMDELFDQSRAVFTNDTAEAKCFSRQIAFNAIPHIDSFMDNGDTREEWKMVAETGKILDPNIRVSATCVRVPVFIGHGEAVHVEFAEPLSADTAREALSDAPGVLVIDRRNDEGYISIMECVGQDEVFVSRIRQDEGVENGIKMWVVSDNLRKGAALNTVQIAESLINLGLKPRA